MVTCCAAFTLGWRLSGKLSGGLFFVVALLVALGLVTLAAGRWRDVLYLMSGLRKVPRKLLDGTSLPVPPASAESARHPALVVAGPARPSLAGPRVVARGAKTCTVGCRDCVEPGYLPGQSPPAKGVAFTVGPAEAGVVVVGGIGEVMVSFALKTAECPPVTCDEAAAVTMPMVKAAAAAAQSDTVLTGPRGRRGIDFVDFNGDPPDMQTDCTVVEAFGLTDVPPMVPHSKCRRQRGEHVSGIPTMIHRLVQGFLHHVHAGPSHRKRPGVG